jgi:hypothetical protein
MIYFNFQIQNPWSDRWNTIWYKSGLLSKYKAWEFNGYRTHHLIEFDTHLTFKGDHAGFHIMIGLFGYAVEFHIYDTRHWDHENNQWVDYGDKL